MNRAQLLDALEALYTGLNETLPQVAGNACGTCKSCCTATLSHHSVADLELDFIANRLGQAAADDFRAYLARETDAEGNLRFGTCPHYKEGCSIYVHRPFSCRIFGHYKEEGTRFPDDCVFDASATAFPRVGYYTELPLTNRMRYLCREFDLHKGGAPAGYARMLAQTSAGAEAHQPVSAHFLNEADPIDRSIVRQIAGDPQGALEELLAAGSPPTWGVDEPTRSNYFHYSLALLYSMQDAHEMAARHYLLTALEVPRADFHYFAGYHLLTLGRAGAGEAQLLRAVELDANHAMSLGFLGYLRIMERRFEEAESYLQRAIASDPSNCFFRLRLGMVLGQLERPEEAREQFVAAAASDATRAEAEKLLSML